MARHDAVCRFPARDLQGSCRPDAGAECHVARPPAFRLAQPGSATPVGERGRPLYGWRSPVWRLHGDKGGMGKHFPDRRKFDFQANEHPVTTHCFLLQIALRASNELETCFQPNTNAITTFRLLFQPIFR